MAEPGGGLESAEGLAFAVVGVVGAGWLGVLEVEALDVWIGAVWRKLLLVP